MFSSFGYLVESLPIIRRVSQKPPIQSVIMILKRYGTKWPRLFVQHRRCVSAAHTGRFVHLTTQVTPQASATMSFYKTNSESLSYKSHMAYPTQDIPPTYYPFLKLTRHHTNEWRVSLSSHYCLATRAADHIGLEYYTPNPSTSLINTRCSVH